MKQPMPEIRLGPLDRVLSVFSPRMAAQRFAAKIALGNMVRAYDGAAKGRSTDGWRSTGNAADSEIAPAAGLLRERKRDLVRNNPLAARALAVLVNNLVGAGIRPRSVSGDKALDKAVDDLWTRWAARCDADGHTDFHGVLALAVREMIEGGEVFALRRTRRKSDGLPVPLQIELKEADHLDAGRNEDRPGAARVRYGIKYNGIALDLHRFRSGLLRAILAIKEAGYGSDTQR